MCLFVFDAFNTKNKELWLSQIREVYCKASCPNKETGISGTQLGHRGMQENQVLQPQEEQDFASQVLWGLDEHLIHDTGAQSPCNGAASSITCRAQCKLKTKCFFVQKAAKSAIIGSKIQSFFFFHSHSTCHDTFYFLFAI